MRTRYLAEVLKFRDEEWRIYFTNPAYLDLVEKCFGQAERRNVAEMGHIRLKPDHVHRAPRLGNSGYSM